MRPSTTPHLPLPLWRSGHWNDELAREDMEVRERQRRKRSHQRWRHQRPGFSWWWWSGGGRSLRWWLVISPDGLCRTCWSRLLNCYQVWLACERVRGRVLCERESEGETHTRARAHTHSPDNRFVLSASEDKTARLWCVNSQMNLVTYRGHNYPVWDVAWSALGAWS